ncbi:MAG: hypothetical protein HY721_06640 [Planctomycetes bacterium]|nr:hypothetical protein [Planctomycetota bacterium]
MPAQGRIPRRLQAVGLFFVFVGAQGTVDPFVLWIVKGRFVLELGSPLGIWLGFSLLHRSDTARWWASLLGWLAAIGGLAGALVALLSDAPLDLEVSGAYVGDAPHWVPLVLSAAVIAAGLSIVFVLRSLRREGCFSRPAEGELDPGSRRRRKAALLAGALAAVAAGALLRAIPEPTNEGGMTTGPSRTLYYVGHGTRYGKLAYVVFQREKGSLTAPVGSDSEGRAHLRLPGGSGEKLRLPGRSQIYEIVEGRLQGSEHRVTLEQFRAYMASDPPEPSLGGLLRFAERPAGR